MGKWHGGLTMRATWRLALPGKRGQHRANPWRHSGLALEYSVSTICARGPSSPDASSGRISKRTHPISRAAAASAKAARRSIPSRRRAASGLQPSPTIKQHFSRFSP
jgi:hypothetical protein